MQDYTEENFENTSSQILDLISNGKMPPSKKAKFVAKLIELLPDLIPQYQTTTSQKKILTHYRVRRTKEGEQKRKQDYVGDFDYKNSRAYKLISKMTKHSNDKMVEGMVKLIIQEEKNHGNNISAPREVYRSKPALYKFIDENYDLFNQYFEAGTKVVTDS